MYLVDFKAFDLFCKKNKLYENEMPITNTPPFILEFKKGDVLMAKIEMSNIGEYNFLRKFGTSKTLDNKYWVRGEEWIIKDGKQIQQLKI